MRRTTYQGSSGLMKPQYVPSSGVVGQAVDELEVEVPEFDPSLVLLADVVPAAEDEL